MAGARSLLLAGLAVAGTCAQTFDWTSIKPSKDLVYTSCYNNTLKCARLELPLDWNNALDTRTVAIAISKLPAVVDDTDPSFSGSIFINPGGPGASGVDFMPTFAEHFQKSVDVKGENHYEIVSFDPRGIAHSTPRSDCWAGDYLSKAALMLEQHGSTGLDGGDRVLGFNLALEKATGKRCEQADKEDPVMAYVDTPSVCLDMIEMLDQIEALRDSNAAKRGLANHRRATEDVPRLQYVGFSYGTLLGNYFAALHPGRVGRIILDGVCDADDYATGPGWTTNTVDTDEIAEQFLEGCYGAGPLKCGLTVAGDTSADDVKDRFYSALADIDKVPLPFVHSSGQVVAVTGNDIRLAVGTMLYKPIDLYQAFSFLFASALSGEPTDLVAALVGNVALPIVNQNCPAEGSALDVVQGVEGQDSVVCLDGDDVTDKDLAYWSDYVAQQTNQSDIFGAYWSTIRFACSGWQFSAKDAFKGPFTTPDPDPDVVPGKPAAPILFLSNRWDPVTPLSAARRMAKQHPGAQVVIQESTGHTALVSAPSDCTDKYVASYFANGTVPDKESVCEADCGPWDTGCVALSRRKRSAPLFQRTPVQHLADGRRRKALSVF